MAIYSDNGFMITHCQVMCENYAGLPYRALIQYKDVVLPV